ncbi:zinc ribbon domain-containing protein [Sphaerimonospora mesophila]|uniref:zinc ribbon domain-containing protein n=1 Tax=Sphaerimonospora mesophila TaxID=37483 RepID=UPI0006E1A7E8
MPRLHSLFAGPAAHAAIAAPLLAVSLVVMAQVAQAAPLPMHPHPSGSTDRVTPGAVRVESSSHVSITLLDDRSIIKQVVREYDSELAKGSGFTVTPDGVVVTATQVVQTDRDPRVYAANRVFAEYFKVKVPADFKRHTLDDPDLNRRLQACYPPQKTDSTCIAQVTVNVTVFPYLDPPAPGGLPAQILTTGAAPAAPAVLKVAKGGEKGTLPTVPLGTALGGAVESIDVMTLTGRPSAKLPPKLDTAHLDPPGSRTITEKEQDKITALLKNGAPGAALIDDAKSEVIGLLSGGGGLPATITPVEEIRTALVAAGVTPRRGPVDNVYETALASYHNKQFANAIPVLRQVLNLRPDHAVAIDHLKEARAKAGATEDGAGGTAGPSAAPVETASGVSPLVLVAGGFAVLVVLVATATALSRRRRTVAAAAGDPGISSIDTPVQTPEPWPAHAVTQVIGAPPHHPAGVGGSGGDPSPPGGTSQPSHPSWPSAPSAPSVPSVPSTSSVPSVPSVPSAPSVPSSPSVSSGPPHGQPQMNFCTQCGMRLGQGHRFCGFCGNPVDSVT